MARAVGARTGHLWCHMTSTLTGEDGRKELDRLALRIGVRLSWRDGDHYDLTPRRRAAAVAAGAVQITTEQAVELTRAHRYGHPLPEWAQEVQPKLL